MSGSDPPAPPCIRPGGGYYSRFARRAALWGGVPVGPLGRTFTPRRRL